MSIFFLSLLALLLFTHPLPSLSASSRQGLTLDVCEKDSDCIGLRNCTKIDSDAIEQPCASFSTSFGCTCDMERPCRNRLNCSKGEICAELSDPFFGKFDPVCISAVAALDLPEWSPFNPGLTMDSCRANKDCVGSRVCRLDEGDRKTRCQPSDKKCVCVPRKPNFCPTLGISEGCELGERCGGVTGDGNVTPTCVSESALQSRKDVFTLGGRLGFEACERKTDCAAGRECVLGQDEGLDFCKGREGCVCRSEREQCSKNGKITRDCLVGEVCVEVKGENATHCASQCRVIEEVNFLPVENDAVLVCPSISPLPQVGEPLEELPMASGEIEMVTQEPEVSEVEEGVCVDAELLGEWEESGRLVFDQHRWAHVMCDMSGSCATEGHMVRWNGRAMMMKRYCDLVGCTRKKLLVNSPRWERGVRVETRTEGLEFAAFAARYGSRIEEHVLRMAMGLGL